MTEAVSAIPLEDFVSGIPVSLAPDAIEHELARMWEERVPPTEGEAETSGVTRITLGNLMWLGTSRHVPRIRTTFSRLVTMYPCRLFLLEFVESRADDKLDAYVNAYCFLASGPRGEVCCEEIHIRFGREGLKHLRGAILPLLERDVPTLLWHFTAQPDRYERILPEMIGIVDRTVCETAFHEDPAEGLRQLSLESSKAQDLAWYRHAPWRDLMAAFFDDEECLELVPEVNEVVLGWAGAANNRHALVACSLLAGWLASRFGWKVPEKPSWPFAYEGPKGPVAVRFFTRPAKQPADDGGLIHFELRTAAGVSLRLETCERLGQVQRIVQGPHCDHRGQPTFVHATVVADDQAIGQALSTRTSSRYFREAAGLAWQLLHEAIAGGAHA